MMSFPISPKILLSLTASLIGTLAVSSLTASLAGAQTGGTQTAAPSIVGAWRADTPLPNGVVQTFRFDADGSFDLAQGLAVDGTYRVDGNKLIETVTLPSVGVSHTDTATFIAYGDSLVVNERGAPTPRVLHRATPTEAKSGIAGDWTISVGTQMAAHYVFETDGTMHVSARVGDERGKYVIRADTLRLSNEQSFQLPATARFAVADSILTLTPPSGKQPRRFHKVSPR
ncbi:MAG: DUF5640 domain-containing protein [Gemmatimonadaceae bacterium]